MFGQDFPVSDYYKGHILDAETITRAGGWWTAILLIEDPDTGKPFIGAYRWQMTENGWKVRKTFSLKRKKDAATFLSIVTRFSDKLT